MGAEEAEKEVAEGAKEEYYKLGKSGTEDCPEGYKTISEADCKKAGGALKLPFYGAVSFPTFPKGCVGQPNQGTVWNNAEDGTASPSKSVVCAKKETAEEAEKDTAEEAEKETAEEAEKEVAEGAKEEYYKLGKSGTEDCPEGYKTISEADCKKAGEALKLPFYGAMSFPTVPKGCVGQPNQ